MICRYCKKVIVNTLTKQGMYLWKDAEYDSVGNLGYMCMDVAAIFHIPVTFKQYYDKCAVKTAVRK